MSLENLSDDTKRKIALFVAGLISVGIFVFWLTDFMPKATDVFSKSKKDGVAFFGKVEENIANIYDTLSNKVGEVKTQVEFIRDNQENQ